MLEKHSPIQGMLTETTRAILRSAKPGHGIGVEEVIRVLDCDVHHADRVLRNMAMAGYLLPQPGRHGLFYWELTPNGNRLALEKRTKRILRTKVDDVIAKVVERAKAINSDPDRLHRITLKLFGSALEDLPDYGDVDIAIALHKRDLPPLEQDRIETALKERQPESAARSFLGSMFAADTQDSKEIRAILKRGLPPLSLMDDDPAQLGVPFKWLINHDIENDQALEVSDAINRPNHASYFEMTDPPELPSETVIRARFRHISDSYKVPSEEVPISVENAPKLEDLAWMPAIGIDGAFVPADRRDDPSVRFAGFQHLCPVWKEDIGGVAMLNKALEWCENHKVWLRSSDPIVSLSRYPGRSVVRFGMSPDVLAIKVTKNGLRGSLVPRTRKKVSRIDLAGAYAVARALGRMYQEASCARTSSFFGALLYLPLIEDDALPDFAKMIRDGSFSEGAFPGLLHVD